MSGIAQDASALSSKHRITPAQTRRHSRWVHVARFGGPDDRRGPGSPSLGFDEPQEPVDLSVAGSCSNHAERQRSEPNTAKA